MAARHDHSKLLAPGCAILTLGLLMHPGLVAQTPTQKPPAKAAKSPDPKDAGSVRKKTAKVKSPLRIAVVDLERAARAHPLFEARSREFSEWGRAQSAKLNDLKKAIQSKQAQLNNTVQPGSAAAEDLEVEIRKLDTALKTRRQFMNQKGLAKEAKLMIGLQDQVIEAIVELAPKRGIDLVLRRRVPHPKAGLQQQLNRSQSTDVLYASDTLDITEDIIEFLKTKYRPK